MYVCLPNLRIEGAEIGSPDKNCYESVYRCRRVVSLVVRDNLHPLNFQDSWRIELFHIDFYKRNW